MSIGVFMLAIAGAFATIASKNAEAKSGSVPGYIKTGIHCVFKNNCQPQDNGMLCRETQSGGAQVFGVTATDVCTTQLYRLP